MTLKEHMLSCVLLCSAALDADLLITIHNAKKIIKPIISHIFTSHIIKQFCSFVSLKSEKIDVDLEFKVQ